MELANKSLKTRIAAFAATGLLALGMGTSVAMADIANSNVKINGLVEGDTVTAYTIATAGIDNANNLTYTIGNGLPDSYDTIAELAAVTSTGYTYNNAGKAAADAIAQNVSSLSVATSGTANASGEATLSLPSGYYLVRVSSTSGKTKIYQNMLVDATPQINASKEYEARTFSTITVKSTDVNEPDKHVTALTNTTDSTDAYQVGDYVPFFIEATIPSYPANSTNATFEICDSMSAGLEIQNDNSHGITVKNGESELTNDECTITATDGGNSLSVALKKDYVLGHASDAITVSYYAKLTEGAFSKVVDGDAQVTHNSATVKFNANPYVTTTNETEPDVVDVKTYGLAFKKVDKDHRPLSGAGFTLYLKNGSNETPVGSEFTTGADGYVYFEDLKAATYVVKETKVPSGKQKMDDQEFTLTSTSATADNPATSDITENNYLKYNGGETGYAIDIVDPDQAVLPTTGGAGTIAVTAAGVALMGAGAGYVMRRRRNAE